MNNLIESYVNCKLCPRNCKVDRMSGEKGFCGQGANIKIARAALHYWEEPIISGEMTDGKCPGSGAVFFSGCNLKCVYCQNHDISACGKGYEITPEELSDEFIRLQNEGALNINLVTAVMYVPSVIRALDMARGKGLTIPIVYNSSGYESVETLKMLEGYVDIYLPDLKYLDKDMAAKFSCAGDYPEIAKTAIAEMVRQCESGLSQGDVSPDSLQERVPTVRLKLLDDGTKAHSIRVSRETRPPDSRRVIVRHMVLPGHTKESMQVIKYLHDTYGDRIYISIMSQYTPIDSVLIEAKERRVNDISEEEWAKLGRRITKREYERVVDYAISLGVKNAYIQEREVAKESFIPKFYGSK